MRGRIGVLGFANTFYMDLFSFTEFSTVFTLSNRSALFLDFKKGSIGMSARRRPMTFNAGLAINNDEQRYGF